MYVISDIITRVLLFTNFVKFESSLIKFLYIAFSIFEERSLSVRDKMRTFP